MKRVIFTAVSVIGMAIMSACTAGTNYMPVGKSARTLSNADLATSDSYVRNLDKNRHEYRACLVEAYIVKNIEHEKKSPGRASDEIIKSACSSYRDAYYASVWASSYPLSNLNSAQFRHNTATTVLRQTDGEMFEFLQSKFPEGQSVTQKYIADVRAAQ